MNPLVLDNVRKQLKSPGFWGKFSGVLLTVLLIIQFYYDVRQDLTNTKTAITKTQNEVEKTDEKVEKTNKKGKTSEESLIGSVLKMQEALQYLHSENLALKKQLGEIEAQEDSNLVWMEQVHQLEIENERLYGQLARFQSIAGVFYEEDMKDKEKLSLVNRLIPILIEEGTGGGKYAMSVSDPDLYDIEMKAPSVQSESPTKKSSDLIGDDGQLEFPELKPVWKD